MCVFVCVLWGGEEGSEKTSSDKKQDEAEGLAEGKLPTRLHFFKENTCIFLGLSC